MKNITIKREFLYLSGAAVVGHLFGSNFDLIGTAVFAGVCLIAGWMATKFLSHKP